MNAFELVVTTASTDIPEAFRDAAWMHLSQITGRTQEDLKRLFKQQACPVVTRTADQATAARLQADLQRAGWCSEVRQVMLTPAPAPAPAPTSTSTLNVVTAAIPATAITAPTFTTAVVSCKACGQANPSSSQFCSACGAELTSSTLLPLPEQARSMADAAANTFGNLVGLQSAKGFNLADLVSEVFKRRSPLKWNPT